MPLPLVVSCLAILLLVLSGCSSGSTATSSVTPGLPAYVNISLSPSTVMPGQSATLTWSSGNATSCTGSGGWSGTIQGSGSMTVMLQGAGSQTYTLLCTGAVGATSKTVTLSVAPGASCPVAAAAVGHGHKRLARRFKIAGSHS